MCESAPLFRLLLTLSLAPRRRLSPPGTCEDVRDRFGECFKERCTDGVDDWWFEANIDPLETCLCDQQGGDACWGGDDDHDEGCFDDDSTVSADSQGQLTCGSAIALMGGNCDDDSALVALGAPAGWIGGLCRESCGYCHEDDQDATPTNCEEAVNKMVRDCIVFGDEDECSHECSSAIAVVPDMCQIGDDIDGHGGRWAHATNLLLPHRPPFSANSSQLVFAVQVLAVLVQEQAHARRVCVCVLGRRGVR